MNRWIDGRISLSSIYLMGFRANEGQDDRKEDQPMEQPEHAHQQEYLNIHVFKLVGDQLQVFTMKYDGNWTKKTLLFK